MSELNHWVSGRLSIVVLVSLFGASCEWNPCADVTCSDHGTCASTGSIVWCECDQGYAPSGLECLADSPDGDADVDGDGDADVDGDGDADGDGDGDADGDGDGDVVWVTIEGGTFMMGSPEDENGRNPDNESQHEVTLTRDFALRATEVTQNQFEDAMGYNPSMYADCGGCPVESLNWYEAAEYCNRLSDREDLHRCYECTGTGDELRCELNDAYGTPYECPGYRLPTEAEWEYAVRAGTTTATYNGDLDVEEFETCEVSHVLNEIAWYCANASGETHDVGGETRANAWGLYDMLGNVWEWCHGWVRQDLGTGSVTDPWGLLSGTFRGVRGGSGGSYANRVRAAARHGREPDYRPELGPNELYIGFRPARTLD